MKLRLIAFSGQGLALAQRLAGALGGEAQRCGKAPFLSQWTRQAFGEADALIFVGAAGIAVRAIAPLVQHKAKDPAVVVVDERGRFAVPILSGHLGGANQLARQVAGVCGAVPVITTATDVNHLFAVDEWARVQGLRVANPARIKAVSAKLLEGGTVTLASPWPIRGTAPTRVHRAENGPADALVSLSGGPADGLVLVPRIAVLGIGCKRGTPQSAIEAAVQAGLARAGVSPLAVRGVCSIDLKQQEAGLCGFCAAHGLPFTTYTAAQLAAVPGQFTGSAFVQRVTGVDNVCERSAVLGSGGTLILKKYAADGVTLAIALAPFAPDWRWQDE